MVLNAILNALKSGLQRDPQRIEERSSTRSLNASKSDLQRVEGGVPFFLLRLRMRRNHNGLACRNYLRGLLLRANRGQPAAGRMRSGSSGPLRIPNGDVLTKR